MAKHITPAKRIASFKPYFFAQLNGQINALKKRKVDVIRIDIGSPDFPPAEFIVDKLVALVRQPSVHGYAQNGGSPNFKQAIAKYYQNRFGVELNPESEVLGLLGSKEGLFHLSQVLLDPGDISLVPDPGYPVYQAGGLIAGAQIYPLPLLAENGFLPDLDSIPEEVASRAKILWLNYPNNPTGAIASLEFFEKAVAFGRRHGILVAHDAPYVDVCFDGYIAPSILQVAGSKDICVEFNSLSKTYNMAGWRLGMVVGNAQVISYLNTYKSQLDSSHFWPMMEAGATAMTEDQGWLEERNELYQRRRDLVVGALQSVGIEVDPPKAAIYVWAKLPKGVTDSTDFCTRLLEETGVSTTPGVVYGEHGEGYFRISISTDTPRLKEAMQRLTDWCTSKVRR
jgi:LL-diaminopimelate aminotransferase